MADIHRGHHQQRKNYDCSVINNFVLAGENIIVWVEALVGVLVSGFTGQTGGSRVARDKGHSIVSAKQKRRT